MSDSFSSFFEVLEQIDPTDFSIKEKLQQRLESPPTKLLAHVLKRDALSDQHARQLLFAPTSADMASVYPQLLLGDEQHPGDMEIAANKAQVIALTHMYLVHGRSWQHMRPFIEGGGLRQLAQLLSHPQPILASQALDMLLYATHPDMFDWSCSGSQQPAISAGSCDSNSTITSSSRSSKVNLSTKACIPDAPAGSAVTHPAAGPDAAIWQELLHLQSGPLLGALLQLSPDRWPAAGFKALQLLTFYLNWLRMWWCKDGVLQLSAGMLNSLSAWSARPTATADERQLATQLLEEFSRHGPAPPAAGVQPATAATSVNADGDAEMALQVVADRTLVNSRPGSEAERLKAAGNDAFKAKDWSTAIQLYSAALDVPVPHEALVDEAPRRATLHANRAAAYLERFKELIATSSTAEHTSTSSGGSEGVRRGASSCWREVGGMLDGLLLDGSTSEARAQLLQAAAMDCRAALDLVPRHAKAQYRLATALRAQGNLKAAHTAAAAAEHCAIAQHERMAASRLAAAISTQMSKVKAPLSLVQQAGPTADKQRSLATGLQASSSSGSGHKPLPTGHADGGRLGSCMSSTTAGSLEHGTEGPVDQLLQQFTAVIKQQGGVLLPSAARQHLQDSDEQLFGDQLALPSASTGGVQSGRQRRPLIEELPVVGTR